MPPTWLGVPTPVPLRGLIRVGLQPSDQFLQVVRWHGLARNDQNRLRRDQRKASMALNHLRAVGEARTDVEVKADEIGGVMHKPRVRALYPGCSVSTFGGLR
jgi:hypothetical protein